MKKYQICIKCVIDNQSYKDVKFNREGICTYCINFKNNIEPLLNKLGKDEKNYTKNYEVNKYMHRIITFV